MVIAAVDVAVVDVAGGVNRLDVIVAAAHDRTGNLALAVGKVRADDYVIIAFVMLELVARRPGEARPTAAALGVVELDHAALALKAFEPADFGGGAVAPQRSRAFKSLNAVVALDFVFLRRVANDGEGDCLFDFLAVHRGDVVYRVGGGERRVDFAVRHGHGIACLVGHRIGNLDVKFVAVLVDDGSGRYGNFAARIAALVIALEFDGVASDVYGYGARVSLAVDFYREHDFVAAEVVRAETTVHDSHSLAARRRYLNRSAVGFAVAAFDVERRRERIIVAVAHGDCRVGEINGRNRRRRVVLRFVGARRKHGKREHRRQKGANQFNFLHLFDSLRLASAQSA